MERKILIIDDSEQTRKNLIDILRNNRLFNIYLEAEDGIEAFRILSKEKVDIIISDVIMPRMDGFKFLSLIKKDREFKDIPVIMLTIRGEMIDKIRGLEIGADDYLIKPFNSDELVAKVKVFLRIKALQDDLKTQNLELERLSVIDSLTQLFNRRYFYDSLKKEFKRSERYDLKLSCMLIDLDNFKDVNDGYGHLTGDLVLKELAMILVGSVREHDTVARYGGDEFAIILPQKNRDASKVVAERIIKTVEGYRFAKDAEGIKEGIKLTVSIGIITYPEHKISDYEEMIKFADQALYSAKAKRNAFRFYNDILKKQE
ncbi:MAG: diguanylate cyclase [Nitrospirae bacterium]|nr:diguanylate cyclase [Nitrospirota bacterium]